MHRFIEVSRIHLIGFFVTALEVAGGAHRIPERAVVARGVLGGIGHNEGVDVTGTFKGVPDGTDSAVHHIGRSDTICPRGSMRQCLLYQGVGRDVV